MSNPKNSYIPFELTDGTKVNLTLTFRKLNLMKSVNPSLYERFNRIVSGKTEEILDLVTAIYAAYWCANYGGDKKIMSEADFVDLTPFDILKISAVFKELTQPKKK